MSMFACMCAQEKCHTAHAKLTNHKIMWDNTEVLMNEPCKGSGCLFALYRRDWY